MQFYLIHTQSDNTCDYIGVYKTYMIAMKVCNSKLYMTGYVLSKSTSVLQLMARLLSLHVLSYALNYVYAFS